MPLINLQTDLKSLKYGNDRLYGASSDQPYITTSIPDNISSYKGTTDFLLRGGTNVTRDTEKDVERIGKMFKDTKSLNGYFFISKQELLSRTAPRTQTSGLLNEGVYSPLNTLTQVGLVAFGGHVVKQGLNPLVTTGAYSTNENLYGVKVKPSQPIEVNRLVQLMNSSVEQKSINLNGIQLNNGLSNILTYNGGPSSTLGVGKTNIRYSKTSQTLLTLAPKQINNLQIYSDEGQNEWTYSSELIEKQPRSIIGYGIASPKIQDFREILRKTLGENTRAGKTATDSGATPLSPDYNTKNIEQRVNLGNPGQRSGKSYADYTTGINYGEVELKTNPFYIGKSLGSYTTGLDKITSVPVYRSEAAAFDEDLNDLVKFRIAIIDNDNPNFKTFMHFRAFLGPMSDSYNAEWNPFRYLGRGENFYTYGGFTRQISLSWTVAAQSKQELIPMYKKLNYLASSLTPDYSPSGYMRGNLAQLTIGGYLYEQPGIITSLTYDVPEESPWEIGINTGGFSDNSVKELSHIIRVSNFSFIPIQNFLPEKQELKFSPDPNSTSATNNGVGLARNFGNQRYISLKNGGNNNYD